MMDIEPEKSQLQQIEWLAHKNAMLAPPVPKLRVVIPWYIVDVCCPKSPSPVPVRATFPLVVSDYEKPSR